MQLFQLSTSYHWLSGHPFATTHTHNTARKELEKKKKEQKKRDAEKAKKSEYYYGEHFFIIMPYVDVTLIWLSDHTYTITDDATHVVSIEKAKQKKIEAERAAEKTKKLREAEANLKLLETKKKNAVASEKSSVAAEKKAATEIAAASKKLAELKK